jgi:hypothetical protein
MQRYFHSDAFKDPSFYRKRGTISPYLGKRASRYQKNGSVFLTSYSKSLAWEKCYISSVQGGEARGCQQQGILSGTIHLRYRLGMLFEEYCVSAFFSIKLISARA